jgi:2-methylisocitrate lyase-like PEP mutase family enzyme
MSQPSTNGHSEDLSQLNPLSGAARLRKLIASEDILVLPGVYDGLTARIGIATGFPALYMTGAGTAASALGMPDLGIATMNDMLTNAAMIASLNRTVPVIADADTGYGGPMMVARTVRSYITAGVAGMHLEDQVVQKRCGHLAGKELVSEEEYYSRIRAAVLARQEMRHTTGGDIVLIARTDALQTYGMDEAMKRLRKCIDLGVDVAFLEGVTSAEQCRQVCSQLAPTPVLLNSVPGGVTPDMSVAEARQLGFKVIIYPALAMSPVVEAVSKAYTELRKTGRASISEESQRMGVKQIFSLCGLEREVAFDAKAGGKSYDRGI